MRLQGKWIHTVSTMLSPVAAAEFWFYRAGVVAALTVRIGDERPKIFTIVSYLIEIDVVGHTRMKRMNRRSCRRKAEDTTAEPPDTCSEYTSQSAMNGNAEYDSP